MTSTPGSGSSSQPWALAVAMLRALRPNEAASVRVNAPWRGAASVATARTAPVAMARGYARGVIKNQVPDLNTEIGTGSRQSAVRDLAGTGSGGVGVENVCIARQPSLLLPSP
jgi:hypothetical protein